jgi:Co/Zn/Cd efflux system component
MDCTSEEQLIRMKLEDDKSIQQLQFDLPNRALTAYHTGNAETLVQKINQLNLGSKLISSKTITNAPTTDETTIERKLLWIVFAINFSFFIIEITAGFIANSMGLVADSLDMMADAIVYGMSLYAVGKLASTKKNIAKAGGIFQITLAILGFIEVIRRFFGFGEIPVFQTMIIISIFALIGNAITLWLLRKSKSKEAHMQASMIFTSNDVIANIGVIMAGIIVYLTNSRLPDLIIGSIVFLLVAKGAVRILKLSKK